MKREWVDDVYKRLLDEDWECLPPYLRGGQMGVGMFMALYSEYKNSRKARNLAAKMLREVAKSIRSLSNHLLDGRIGIAWGMKYLSDKRILEEDDALRDIHKKVLNECLSYCSMTPIYLPKNEHLFSVGLYIAQLFRPEDSLERYILEERLLELIDECDRQLHTTIKGIYSPKNMSLSMLHSILCFLKKMDRERIYPYQTQKLIECAENVYDIIKHKGLLDDYVCRELMGKMNTLQKGRTIDFYMKFIGSLGYYSLLYNCPEIFNTALKKRNEQCSAFSSEVVQLIQKGPVDIETLCGWGLGLLTYTNQEGNEK